MVAKERATKRFKDLLLELVVEKKQMTKGVGFATLLACFSKDLDTIREEGWQVGHKQTKEDYLWKIEKEIKEIRKRFRCGKCDGAKNLRHALWCVAISELSSKLKNE